MGAVETCSAQTCSAECLHRAPRLGLGLGLTLILILTLTLTLTLTPTLTLTLTLMGEVEARYTGAEEDSGRLTARVLEKESEIDRLERELREA